MGLDPELLHEPEVAKEHLAVSQHAAERARADYHHAIRRRHAAGGSLREIAEALRLSHQRVHQTIDEAARRRGGGVGVPNS
jgi:DNA-directed RNA polymerase specialized sigma24 family protein